MPIYEYRCEKCGDFEVTQRITDNPLSRCPTCRSKVKKLISNTSFQLKGTGWYITDYARKQQPGADGSTGKSETSQSTGKSETSESKSNGKASTEATPKTNKETSTGSSAT